MYNYLIVGSDLYGATFAQQAHAAGKYVLVIDRRPHVAVCVNKNVILL